jgi:hypothetical protein
MTVIRPQPIHNISAAQCLPQIQGQLTIWGKSRESLPMVLKTRSWSLLTVPKRSSPRVVIVNEAYSRPESGVCSRCRDGSQI